MSESKTTFRIDKAHIRLLVYFQFDPQASSRKVAQDGSRPARSDSGFSGGWDPADPAATAAANWPVLRWLALPTGLPGEEKGDKDAFGYLVDEKCTLG